MSSSGSNPWVLSFGTASSITDNGSDFALTMNGAGGKLILSGTDSYHGGTFVNAGTLVVTSNAAIPAGTSLTIGAGATFIFDPSQAVAGLAVSSASPAASTAAGQPGIAAVPESGTLVLLVAAALVAGLGVWRRRKV